MTASDSQPQQQPEHRPTDAPHLPCTVTPFVASVRRRVNGQRLLTISIWATALGALALVVIGLVYVVQGYALPLFWLGVIATATAFSGLVAWLTQRLNLDRAAHLADDHFSLKDTLASYLHFQQAGRHDGFYALQAKQTAAAIEPLDPKQIRYTVPYQGVLVAMGLLALAIPIGMRGPSDFIKQKTADEAAMLTTTAELKEQLKELIEELKIGTDDPNEKALLKPDELKKWVDELTATKDQTEALRQFARLERKLNDARAALQRKQDEQLLDKAAKELNQSEETKSLAKKLEQKKYDEAAEDLKKLDPTNKKAAETKPLSKQKRDLARLKATAQRMAAAAKAQQKSNSSKAGTANKGDQGKQESAKSAKNLQSKTGQASAGQNSSAKNPNDQAGEPNEGEPSELAQAMEELDGAVSELEAKLEECEQCEAQNGKCDKDKLGECENCKIAVGKKLSELDDQLKKLSMRRKAEAKLKRLCQACSQSQSGICNRQSQSQALVKAPNAGGTKAGWGSSDATRDQNDEVVDNGQTTQLTGQKGSGPSLTTIEAADDGSGVSNRKSSVANREFKRQYESFVQREDVPEQVKAGVKNYFEMIHENGDE